MRLLSYGGLTAAISPERCHDMVKRLDGADVVAEFKSVLTPGEDSETHLRLVERAIGFVRDASASNAALIVACEVGI